MDEFTADFFISRHASPEPEPEHEPELAPEADIDSDIEQETAQDSSMYHQQKHKQHTAHTASASSSTGNTQNHPADDTDAPVTVTPPSSTTTPTTQQKDSGKSSLRKRMAAIRDKAALQDRLLENQHAYLLSQMRRRRHRLARSLRALFTNTAPSHRVLAQIVPAEDDAAAAARRAAAVGTGMEFYENRPTFNITTMSNNFRRFNARIGVVFKFQEQVVRILTWQRYSHTLSVLAVYSFVCLDPHLLPILPLAGLLLGVFIPSFLARHPAPPHGPESLIYSPRGPPLAPARTIKPAKELSRDFFQNMRDLQNCMDDFCVAHDQVVATIVPMTNFSDEARSSAVFLFMFVASVLMSISAHLLPWRILFLVGGWITIVTNHPLVAHMLATTRREHVSPQEAVAAHWLDAWIQRDIMLDSAPETREVEVFELQRMTGAGAGEWEPWLFSPSPYDPLSQQRLTDERPRGTRFFEDVLPPDGWEWSEKKWALDLWSREWVEDRIITGVEVETEGERWVYDMCTEANHGRGFGHGHAHSHVEDDSSMASTSPQDAGRYTSWEEKTDRVGQRGEWRRRRWVRVVRRQMIEEPA